VLLLFKDKYCIIIIIINMSTENKETEKVQIGLAEISSCVTIIDMVTTRGGFKGPELSSVGMLRDRLALFVEQNKPTDSKDEKNQSTVTQ